MATAVRMFGEPRIIASPLEERIAASIRAWERYNAAIAPGFPEHVCCDPLRIESESGGWAIVETRCVWTLFVATLMPLCDTIEVFVPQGAALAGLDVPPQGTCFLSLERLVAGPPIVNLVEASVGKERIEILRLSGLSAAELRELLAMAETHAPVFTPPV